MLNTGRAAYFLALLLACTAFALDRVAAAPQAPSQKPARPPITIPHDTDGLKDCGTDSACFLAALEDGKPAKLQRTSRLSEDGTSIVEESYVQVSNFTGDQCTYFARLESLNVTHNDEARARLRKEGVTEAEFDAIPEETRQMAGEERACVFLRASLVTLMRRWNQEQTGLADFMRAEHCEGDFAPIGASFFAGAWGDPFTHTARSWWLLQTGKIDDAEEELRLAFAVDPPRELAEAHQNMGQIYLRRKQLDPALAEFLKAVELNPLSHTAWSDLGLGYARRGDVEKAAEQFRRQIDVNKKNGLSTQPAFSMWCLLYGDGRVENTVDVCEDALKSNQEDPLVWNQLAWTYATSKAPRYRDSAKALKYAQKAVSLSEGKRPEILDTLAEAYFVNGDFDKAIETERKALELDPDSAMLKESLARYLRAQNAKR